MIPTIDKLMLPFSGLVLGRRDNSLHGPLLVCMTLEYKKKVNNRDPKQICNLLSKNTCAAARGLFAKRVCQVINLGFERE